MTNDAHTLKKIDMVLMIDVYSRLHGKLVATYESAATRRFQLGRVDNVKPRFTVTTTREEEANNCIADYRGYKQERVPEQERETCN